MPAKTIRHEAKIGAYKLAAEFGECEPEDEPEPEWEPDAELLELPLGVAAADSLVDVSVSAMGQETL